MLATGQGIALSRAESQVLINNLPPADAPAEAPLPSDVARQAFEAKYFISSAVRWNGLAYEARPGNRRAEKEAARMSNWLGGWRAGIAWASANNPELTALREAVEEQRRTIVALNTVIGGEGSTTTENLVRTGRLYADQEAEMALMRNALENCRLLAARHRKEDWARDILRFCAEGGSTSDPLRKTSLLLTISYLSM